MVPVCGDFRFIITRFCFLWAGYHLAGLTGWGWKFHFCVCRLTLLVRVGEYSVWRLNCFIWFWQHHLLCDKNVRTQCVLMSIFAKTLPSISYYMLQVNSKHGAFQHSETYRKYIKMHTFLKTRDNSEMTDGLQYLWYKLIALSTNCLDILSLKNAFSV